MKKKYSALDARQQTKGYVRKQISSLDATRLLNEKWESLLKIYRDNDLVCMENEHGETIFMQRFNTMKNAVHFGSFEEKKLSPASILELRKDYTNGTLRDHMGHTIDG